MVDNANLRKYVRVHMALLKLLSKDPLLERVTGVEQHTNRHVRRLANLDLGNVADLAGVGPGGYWTFTWIEHVDPDIRVVGHQRAVPTSRAKTG